jgi:hypothetical protein
MSFTTSMDSRGVYSKPLVYTALHVGYGYFAAFAPAAVISFFIIWQLGQLILDIRVFLLSMKYEHGNNRIHTAKKFAEFLTGLALGLLTRQYFGAKWVK